MKHKIKANLPIRTKKSSAPQLDVPFWDATLRKLHFRGECIKAFTGPAENQEAILFALQQSGWVLIDNPLLPDPEVDGHRQLEYAVRRLNGHQHPQQRLRFHVCDYGKKISWEALRAKPAARTRKFSKKQKQRNIE